MALIAEIKIGKLVTDEDRRRAIEQIVQRLNELIREINSRP